MRNILIVLLNPSCWSLNYPVSLKWDDEFNKLLEKHNFEYINRYEAKLGNHSLWIENYPYGCFTKEGKLWKVCPRRVTIIKAYKKFLKDIGET